MSLLSLLKKREPSAKKEKPLNKKKSPAEHSPETTSRLLGQRLFVNTLALFPDCLLGVNEYTFTPPFAYSCKLKIFQPTRYFEDAFEETLQLWEEETEEKEVREILTSSKGKLRQYAWEMAKVAYASAIQSVAGYILQGCPSPAKPLEKALQDYEKITFLSQVNLSNTREESLERTVYLSALMQTKANYDTLLSLSSEEFGTDKNLLQAEKMLYNLEKYSKKKCFSPEEQKNLQKHCTEMEERYTKKFQEAEKLIGKEQDNLYEQWEASVTQGFLEEAERTLKLLSAFTKMYSALLEETEEEIVLKCRKKFSEIRKEALLSSHKRFVPA